MKQPTNTKALAGLHSLNNSTKTAQGQCENTRKSLKRKLFPKNLPHCFECGAKLTSANRKRMAIARIVAPTQGCLSGYQLCKACAAKLDAGQMHLMPRICSDLKEADFLTLGKTVGGIQ